MHNCILITTDVSAIGADENGMVTIEVSGEQPTEEGTPRPADEKLDQTNVAVENGEAAPEAGPQ